jgi:hypothetical protein
MLREAMQYLLGLGKVNQLEVNGQVYVDKDVRKISEPVTQTIHIQSLTGLVDYIKSNFDGEQELMIHVENHLEISVFTKNNSNMVRNVFIKAEPDLPRFRYEDFMDAETFNIKLQSMFVPNEDRDIMLKVVGNIKDESVKQIGDNGVSQAVTIRTGVSTVGDVVVPNPVSLKPYRTFLEVDQPASNFVFRMRDGGRCAIFEADGGAWKNKAMVNIKDYLGWKLHDEIEKGLIHIIA